LLVSDFRAVLAGDRVIARDWALHGAGLIGICIWIAATGTPPLLYPAAAYSGMAILKIRTFLEHRAHELARGRSVIVEGRGLLPFLFLNNNLHTVHHTRPCVAWYRLPALYAENRDGFLKRNEGYVYPSYTAIFRQYFLTPKDPVPHPLRPSQ
ncbi:MAG: fatty acid desaturase, partial [Albidovulum sp.]|uniref:fatty acid desaturase n=1 Tax=Albidovulum sp. TaxID=1872424 RepID=UPI003CA7BED0